MHCTLRNRLSRVSAPTALCTSRDSSAQAYTDGISSEALTYLRQTLVFGALLSLLATGYDFAVDDLTNVQLAGRTFIAISLFVAWLSLQRVPIAKARNRASAVASASACATGAGLFGMLWAGPTLTDYSATWPGLLPVYFFAYGQLAIPIKYAIAFGVVTWFGMLCLGYSAGLSPSELGPSALMLGAVNLLGVITRLQMEKQAHGLRVAYATVERQAAEQTQAVRDTSHNLQQMLFGLRCHANALHQALARNEHEDLVSTAAEYLEAIEKTTDNLRSIQDVFRLESYSQTPTIAPVAINELLHRLALQFQPQALAQGLRLKVFYRQKPPFYLATDSGILFQVLSNLLDNAVKYTRHGGIFVSAIRICPKRLSIRIKDTGMGIPKAQQEAIFKAYYRGNRRRGDPQCEGSGLGLAYVRTAVNRLPEHSLRFRSSAESGTRFEVLLSVVEHNAALTDVAILKNKRIFLVGSANEIRDDLTNSLVTWGAHIEIASTRNDVNVYLEEAPLLPDMLICLDSPAEPDNLAEIVASVTAHHRHMPTVILSSRGFSVIEKHNLPVHAQLLRLPIDRETLKETLVRATYRSAKRV